MLHKILEKLRFLGANGLAAVMDLGVGALLAVVISLYSGAAVTPLTLAFGALLAVLPDFDVVPRILTLRWVRTDHHDTLLHKPAFLMMVAGAIAYFFGDQLWLVIALVCLTYHYLHDTAWRQQDNTSGISWLWPFSARCVTWTGLYDRTSLNRTHQEWLNHYWLRPSHKALVEICTGLVTFSLGVYLSGLISLLIIPVLVVVAALFVWVTAPLVSKSSQTRSSETL